MAYKTTDHFLVKSAEVMNLRSDDGNKYGDFDPSYEFIESEVLLNSCNCGTEEYPEDRFPDYCPECIEKCYEYCTDAVAAFAKDDVIRESE